MNDKINIFSDSHSDAKLFNEINNIILSIRNEVWGKGYKE